MNHRFVPQLISKGDALMLTLPGYLPATPNTLRGKHWSVVRKEKTRAARALAIALIVAGRANRTPSPKGSRWQLHIVRRGPGMLDRDNLPGAYKQLQDAIVDAGLIPGDTARILWPTHSDMPTKCRDEQGTLVMLRRVPEGEELAPWFPRCAAQGGFLGGVWLDGQERTHDGAAEPRTTGQTKRAHARVVTRRKLCGLRPLKAVL